MHDVPAEIELLDHARRVVLDDEVGLLDQAQREVASLGAQEVEGEVALVGVRGVEERAVLPPVVAVGADAAGVAHAVGPGDRLHVDDVGTERGEHRRGRRSRPPRGEVEDPDPLRAGVRAGRVAGGFGGRATTVPVCSPSRGAGRGGGDTSPSIFHGRRGTRKVPVGSSTSEPRALACSNSATAGPSETGATGIRSSAASATTSAVVCLVVQSWMIPFHSSQFMMRALMGAQNPSSMRSGRSIINRKLSNCVRVLVLNPT